MLSVFYKWCVRRVSCYWGIINLTLMFFDRLYCVLTTEPTAHPGRCPPETVESSVTSPTVFPAAKASSGNGSQYCTSGVRDAVSCVATPPNGIRTVSTPGSSCLLSSSTNQGSAHLPSKRSLLS